MAAIDLYSNQVATPGDSPRKFAAITPSDSTDLTYVTKSIYVGGAGAIAIIGPDGDTVTFAAVPVGTLLRIQAARVKSTGTTATNLIACWG